MGALALSNQDFSSPFIESAEMNENIGKHQLFLHVQSDLGNHQIYSEDQFFLMAWHSLDSIVTLCLRGSSPRAIVDQYQAPSFKEERLLDKLGAVVQISLPVLGLFGALDVYQLFFWYTTSLLINREDLYQTVQICIFLCVGIVPFDSACVL